MSVGARARNFKIKDDWGHHVRMLNGSTALEEGDMAAVSSGVLVEVADSCTTGIVGVVQSDASASEYVTVVTAGLVEGTADTGVNFAIGDAVYAASDSALDAGSSGDKPLGYVVHVDPAAAGAVKFLLLSTVEHQVDARGA